MKSKIHILILILLLPLKVSAAQVGSFHKQCFASNWQTGKVEVVEEINVYQRGSEPVLAFTKRLPDGHWRIEWNYDRIIQYRIPNDVVVFLFYHECAHAKSNSENEAEADCQALRDMQRDGYINERTYRKIESTYQMFGRRFPSGHCG